MNYRIKLIRNWPGRRDVLTPGIYRVPTDIPVPIAERMLAERAAERVTPVIKRTPAADPATLQVIERCYDGGTIVVAGTGPSLTPAVVEACRNQVVIAVNDAYQLFPWAVALYACDAAWWDVHKGCPDFAGAKWSSHTVDPKNRHNDKLAAAAKYGLKLVEGRSAEGFSTDPAAIHYGSNSGFQAVNLALLMGAARIVLVGFDMRVVDKQRHFFGDHPPPLRNGAGYTNFIRAFERAAKTLPAGVEILNATPDSALKCFPAVELADALSG